VFKYVVSSLMIDDMAAGKLESFNQTSIVVGENWDYAKVFFLPST